MGTIVMPEAEYRVRLERRRAAWAEYSRRNDAITRGRLAVGVCGVFLFWLVFVNRGGSPLWMALPVVVFIWLVALHERTLRALRTAKRSVGFYEGGVARFDGTWPGKGVSGEQFRSEGHPYADSLDLFGRGSLFELICSARTHEGEKTLAGWLLTAAPVATIESRQQAVSELRDRLDLREELAVIGDDVRAGVHAEQLERWAEGPAVLQRRWYRPAVLLLPILTLAGGAIWWWSGVRIPFLLAALAQLMLAFHLRDRVNQVVADLEEPAGELRLMAALLERIEKGEFRSPHLRALLAALATGGVPPSARIARLAQLFDLLELRHNQFFAPIAAVLLWGPHVSIAVERWRLEYGPSVRKWIEALGEFEALCSLAGYAWEHPGDPFPKVTEGPGSLDGVQLAHPLIAPDRVVANSVRLRVERPLLIVSGSNMSGKSTLLRTVGVNAVLAQAGAPVRAASLTMSPLAVGASIRVVDSLQEGRSRFFAEITRLRQLVDLTRGPQPLLFLLDELLSGTNSNDRRIGATGVMQGLVARGAIGMITTHDLALTGMAGVNVHFEDHFEDGHMSFDYVIRPGVVAKSNALELMRSLGLDV